MSYITNVMSESRPHRPESQVPLNPYPRHSRSSSASSYSSRPRSDAEADYRRHPSNCDVFLKSRICLCLLIFIPCSAGVGIGFGLFTVYYPKPTQSTVPEETKPSISFGDDIVTQSEIDTSDGETETRNETTGSVVTSADPTESDAEQEDPKDQSSSSNPPSENQSTSSAYQTHHQYDTHYSVQEGEIQCGTLDDDDERHKRDIPYDAARIVGGYQSEISNHPWQVSLWAKGAHTCGGCIITPYWIIFAAHCVEAFPYANNWTVYAGESSRYDMRHYLKSVKRNAHVVVTHNAFTTATYNKDVALLRLDEPLEFGRNIRPICLTTDEIEDGALCQISGWGAPSEGSDLPDHIHSTDVRVITRNTCNRPDWLQGLVNEYMICAGTVDGSRDACQGDSGGPLACYDEHLKRYILTGVVSWGIGCGEERMPGVYTNLARLKSWIDYAIERVEDDLTTT